MHHIPKAAARVSRMPRQFLTVLASSTWTPQRSISECIAFLWIDFFNFIYYRLESAISSTSHGRSGTYTDALSCYVLFRWLFEYLPHVFSNCGIRPKKTLPVIYTSFTQRYAILNQAQPRRASNLYFHTTYCKDRERRRNLVDSISHWGVPSINVYAPNSPL